MNAVVAVVVGGFPVNTTPLPEGGDGGNAGGRGAGGNT